MKSKYTIISKNKNKTKKITEKYDEIKIQFPKILNQSMIY